MAVQYAYIAFCRVLYFQKIQPGKFQGQIEQASSFINVYRSRLH